MPMLAEVVDAVVGGDTHRDTHALELTAPSGATIATLMIGNDERGFADEQRPNQPRPKHEPRIQIELIGGQPFLAIRMR
jgi:hypothetical protein